jgi:hypothetical protein
MWWGLSAPWTSKTYGRRFEIVVFELFHLRRGLAWRLFMALNATWYVYNCIRVETQIASEMSILDTYWTLCSIPKYPRIHLIRIIDNKLLEVPLFRMSETITVRSWSQIFSFEMFEKFRFYFCLFCIKYLNEGIDENLSSGSEPRHAGYWLSVSLGSSSSLCWPAWDVRYVSGWSQISMPSH